jgi:hypothetical protein
MPMLSSKGPLMEASGRVYKSVTFSGFLSDSPCCHVGWRWNPCRDLFFFQRG